MWVPTLGREDPLEKGMATPQCSRLDNPLDCSLCDPWWATVHGVTKESETA